MSWLAIELYRRGMVKVGKFKLSSGLESPFYIDLRLLYSHPDLVEKIVNELITLVDIDRYDVIVGIATSGAILATFMACKLKKPLAYVRIEKKTYGTQALVEGLVSMRRCIIVDDVATTGSSIEHAYNAIKEVGGMPMAAIVVVDREQGARKRVEALGIKLYSYIKALDIFSHLYENGLIGKELYIEIVNHIKSSVTNS